MARVLVVLAEDNFKDCEYLVPRAFFEQAGFEVCSVSEDYLSTGRYGYSVENEFTFDTDFEELCDFDCLYIVSKIGSKNNLINSNVKDLINIFIDSNRVIGFNYMLGSKLSIYKNKIFFNDINKLEKFSLDFINLLKLDSKIK